MKFKSLYGQLQHEHCHVSDLQTHIFKRCLKQFVLTTIHLNQRRAYRS